MISFPFTCCPMNRGYSWKEKPDGKKVNSALQHVRTDFWCMIGEERHDSFTTDPNPNPNPTLTLTLRSLSYRNLTIDFQGKSVDWFLYIRDLCHEWVNTLLLAFIHRDIFLDYDKIIDIYASKYPGWMLLINPLCEE